MGIDAEILIRNVPKSTVTDEWLREKSWQLVTAIGSEHFFITDGLPTPEYETARKAWFKAFDEHPRKKDWDEKRDPGAHKAITDDIGKAPNVRRLAIDRTMTRYREDGDPDPGAAYDPDGDRIFAVGDECLLEVSLGGRYYGEGYERGDILTYCAVAEWIEDNIEGAEVYYGGDSSGVLPERFDADRRLQLRKHLYSKAGRDYFRHDFGSTATTPPACSLCPSDQYRGSQYGYGQAYAAFHCSGCGKTVDTRDGGKTWEKSND